MRRHHGAIKRHIVNGCMGRLDVAHRRPTLLGACATQRAHPPPAVRSNTISNNNKTHLLPVTGLGSYKKHRTKSLVNFPFGSSAWLSCLKSAARG